MTMWSVCLIMSIVVLVVPFVISWVANRIKPEFDSLLAPSKVILFDVVASATILFYPIYRAGFEEIADNIHLDRFLAVVLSLHNTIRLFVVDGDFTFITENLAASDTVEMGYYILSAVLFVLAPVLTFGFVLSFFKNLSATVKYFFSMAPEIYIFSELNEKSLTLAKSLEKSSAAAGKKRLLVFTDVFENNEEQSYELIHKAKLLRALCFKKDIAAVNFKRRLKKSETYFFFIGKDEDENISQALKIAEKFRHIENSNLYVFSTKVESDILFAGIFDKRDNETDEPALKIRRVNEVHSLINRTLYESGYEKIFCSAREEDGIKKINALVVGMGQHGTEMTKALSWFCQMDGYKVEINALDINKKAKDKFVSLCPELMSDKFNHHFDIEGEAGYSINIHPGIDVEEKAFGELLGSLPEITYAFVSLGSDEKNISTAIKLREVFLRRGLTPVIQAVVVNTDKKNSLTGAVNFKNQEYGIDFIGDIGTSYSEKVILSSDVEEKALKRHLKWGAEKTFWQYDYNRKSSTASAIHREMKIKCGIPGIEKDPENRTEEEKWPIRILEHKRWNAYMRSEGYMYGEERMDIAKVHNLLVPFDKLSEKEQEKDDD